MVPGFLVWSFVSTKNMQGGFTHEGVKNSRTEYDGITGFERLRK